MSKVTGKNILKRYRWAFIAGILFATVCFVVLDAATPTLSSPQFCGTLCHEMGEVHENWKLSTHHNNPKGVSVGCVDCHLPPKERFFSHHAAKAWTSGKDTFLHFFGGDYEPEQVRRAVVDAMKNESCVYCHNNLLAQPSSSAVGIIHAVSLDEPENINYRCAKCHDNLHGQQEVLTRSRRSEQKITEEPEIADNSYCYVCHLNYQEEEFTTNHQLAGVGCEDCHGISDRHSSDEDGVTPPDIMYPEEKINPSCLECHPKEEIIDQIGHRPFFSETDTERQYCMACHGLKHRLEVRTRRWDKQTGELIWDDGVRMMKNPDSEQN